MAMKDSFHSRAYHRYFEGYEEREQCNESGGITIRRFYTGMYYKQDISDKHRAGTRILFALAYLLSVTLFLYSATRPVACNAAWYVAIPSVGSLVFLVLTGVYLFFNLTSPRQMQIRSFRDSHERLTAVSGWTAGFLMATAVFSFFSLVSAPNAWESTVLCAVMYLLSSLCMFAVCVTERHTRYLTVESDYPHQTKGSRINYLADY